MNILFYVEPLIEQDKPYWKEGWANYVSWNIIKTLRKAEDNYEFVLIANEAIAQTIDGEKNIAVHALSQQELLKPFDTNYLTATTAWHNNSYTQKQMTYYKELMSRKLEAYIPDVIITFSPVPFLASLYPNALVLHHEFSIFSRLPYPMSWFLDPIGMHSSSYFDKFKTEIEKLQLSSEQIQLLGNFKQLCQQTLKKKSPFESIFIQKREQFDHLVLLPLQFSRYYLFDDLVPFKSQYEYCVYVLENVPPNIGVVVNMHPEYPVLSEDAIKFLQWIYPHFISLQEFNTIYASGQFILPFVDGVITVSSSLALQALLFDKKVITLGKKCFHYLADAINLDNIEKTLSLPAKNKDALLYYILTRYAIIPRYLHDPIWLSKFLNKSLDKFRGNGIDFDFYDAMDSDENIFQHLSSVINEQSKVVPQYVSGHVIQLFIDQGDGISEENSIKLPVAQNVQSQEFTFDLTDKQTIKTLRLDPLSECCVIEIESLYVRKNATVIDLLPYVHSNAEIHHGKSLFFTTNDPQMYFSGLDESTFEGAQLLVVVLRYMHIAKDALHVCVKQKNQELLDKEHNIQSLNQELLDKEHNIQSLNQELLDKEHNIQSLNQELLDKEHNIQSLNQELLDKEHNINEFNQKLAVYRNSLSWRVTKPMRILNKIVKKLLQSKDELSIIKKSSFWNSQYYLDTYLDIKDAGIDPLRHFCDIGWKEGKNPSSKFDTNFYLEMYKDVKDANINPLIHYLKNGKNEGRLCKEGYTTKLPFANRLYVLIYKVYKNPVILRKFILEIKKNGYVSAIKKSFHYIDKPQFRDKIKLQNIESIHTFFNQKVQLESFITKKPIDIIIPVYNGFEYLEPLFNSIIKNTTLPYRLLIADDQSPDPEVLPFLYQIQETNKDIDIVIVKNDVNLGFLKTVNKLVKYTNNHFVLLNTDTEVPSFWLERLMYPIFKMKKVASTTPFTNAGTICSFPNYLEDNTIFENLSVEEVDGIFKFVKFENTYIEIPTGVGFCMGVNKNLVEKIGMFDEIYGKGYGEENDWCQRAIKEGYKNIHVTNLFVYHKHGGSFLSEEKKKLIKANSKKLCNKFSNYNADVANIISENKLKFLREILILKILNNHNNIKLFITHSLGGGADEYINSYRVSDKVVIIFTYNVCKCKYEIIISGQYFHSSYECNNSVNTINSIVNLFTIKDIYINNLVSFPIILNLLDYLSSQKIQDVQYTYLLHDYYAVCPMYNLLDYQINFCNVPEDRNYCNKCIQINPLIKRQADYITYEYPNLDIQEWRDKFLKLLNSVDKILVFSESSKKILLKCYKNIDIEKIIIKQHSANWVQKVENNDIKDSLNIAIIGTITVHKGYSIVSSMATFIDNLKLNVKLHIFGQIIEPYESISLCDSVILHGKYNKSDLTSLMINNNINLVFITSICPETFSYTTQEAINMHMNIACFDLGAPEERLRKYDKSLIITSYEVKDIMLQIFDYFNLNKNKIENNNIKNNIVFVIVSNNDLIYKNSINASYHMTKYKIIKFDNIFDNLPIPVRYNSALQQFKANHYDGWIFLVHNDFSILEDVENIVKNLDKSNIYGSIGAILKDKKKYLYGEIYQGHQNSLIKHGIQINKPTLVDTIDCQCIFFHSDIIKQYDLQFDECIDLHFHQYTEEFCLNAKKLYSIKTYAVPFLCKHTSWGSLNAGYYRAEKYLIEKFGDNWAGTCTHL